MKMMFKETRIPEDYSKEMALKQFKYSPSDVYKIVTVLFHGTSKALGAIKNTTIPKAIVIRSLNNSFVVGAKVEYIKNEDNPKDPSAGRWDYTWSFYEDDFKDCDIIDASVNNNIGNYYIISGLNLYGMDFQHDGICAFMIRLAAEMIKNFMLETATDAEPNSLVLEGVFTATAEVVDGKTEIGIVPAGEMKVLIKDDTMIQEF